MHFLRFCLKKLKALNRYSFYHLQIYTFTFLPFDNEYIDKQLVIDTHIALALPQSPSPIV